MCDALSAFRLNGRRALVTGAASGIGRAISVAFSEAGAELVIADRDGPGCEELAGNLAAEAIVLDLGDKAALADLGRRADDVDILVCNAGVAGNRGQMHEATAADWEQLRAVNLDHPLHLSGMIAPSMARRGRGSIVLMSSIAGLRGNAAIGLYGLTKAAISQLARNLAVEWGPRNVRANAIAPGLISTNWASEILRDEVAASRRLELTPLRRLGTPEEIANVALFLASDSSSFVTGQTIVADGGTLICDGAVAST